jgi:hypothetical protein
MSNKRIENVINDSLKGEARKNALDFIGFLRSNEIPIEESENYWEIKYKDDGLCFIWIDGSDNRPGPWTVWSHGEYDIYLVDDNIKEIAWANVNPCGSCGGNCKPGRTKTIFGKKFDNICNSVMAFTNPEFMAIECAKKLVEIRMNESKNSV